MKFNLNTYMKEVVKYISFDGKEFESPGDCHAYEAAFRHTNKVYEKIKELILGWLDTRGCLNEFLQNAKSTGRFDETYLNGYFIKGAFSWKDTPEGIEFWTQIDKDYQKFWETIQNLKITIKDIEFYLQTKENNKNN